MAEDQGKEEEKFDFTSEGEGYISLDEARVLAMRTAVETPGNYGSAYQGVSMVFEVASLEETDDFYEVTLLFRPQGDFNGTPGQEQFVVGKEGTIAVRQVLSLPTQTSASQAGTAKKGGGFPMLPVAIGVVVVGIIAAVGAVVILMSSGGDSVPVAVVIPTETPAPTETPTSIQPTVAIEKTKKAPTATKSPSSNRPGGTQTLEEYASNFAGGPGAIYIGDFNQLVGLAPHEDLGGFEGEVPLNAIKEHAWIYESGYYKSLLETAKLTNPTELASTGENISLQHACINRTLLWCKLIGAYLIPNLTERTNGQVEFSVSSFPELGLAGTDTMSLVRDGTLGAVEIYGGYIGGEYPVVEANYLWGLWPSHEVHYTVQNAIFDDIEKIIGDATGAKVWSRNWIPGDDQMFFSKKALRTLEDFDGLKTRSHSAALSDWIDGMGAEAQFVAFAEVYSALERGILDAGVTGASPGFAQRWYEVTDYMNGGLYSFNSTTNVINESVWNDIPADLQQIILEEGAKLELEALRIAAIQNQMGIARNVVAGLEHVEFSDELKDYSFNVAALQHVLPAWIRRVGGPNSPAVTEMFNKKIGPIVGVQVVPNNSSQGFIVQKTR